jgi:hypothetical protein
MKKTRNLMGGIPPRDYLMPQQESPAESVQAAAE